MKKFWVLRRGSREEKKEKVFENWIFEPFKNRLFVHFASQWLTIQSRAYSRNVQIHRARFRWSGLSCEALANESWNSLSKFFELEIFSNIFATRPPLANGSWGSRKNLCPNLLRERNFLNLFTTWMGVHPLVKWVTKFPNTQFFNTENLIFWEKISKHKW